MAMTCQGGAWREGGERQGQQEGFRVSEQLARMHTTLASPPACMQHAVAAVALLRPSDAQQSSTAKFSSAQLSLPAGSCLTSG